MDQNRKYWNDQQKKLRQALNSPANHSQAIAIFLTQHAMVHPAAMSESGLWSFADEIWDGLTEEDIRLIPRGSEHSIAWIFWHMTRIEDVTMNMLVSGTPQLFYRDRWYDRLGIPYRDTGNTMDKTKIAALSMGIDIPSLYAYRIAVARRTREIVTQLKSIELAEMVDASRLRRILEEGAVVENARDLIEYWGGLTRAGLLLMPPTRHNFVHLNEASRIKQIVKRQSRLNK